MKGKKACPTCNSPNALRSSKCIGCDHSFYETEEDKSSVDWRSLTKGQTIKSFIGSGPYYDSPSGERIYLGHFGKFTVISVFLNQNGFLARNEEGTSFLYMGPDKLSNVVGVLSAHKIKLVKDRTK